MTDFASAIFEGHVVHKRLTPKRHGFTYRVFALLLDVDEIETLATSLRFFSRNQRNFLSFHDADHGSGDGTPVAVQIRATLTAAGFGHAAHRIALLCYPRVLGFVFNPLSVYFCHGSDGRLAAVVYEVSNTFGERQSYVIPVAAETRAGMVIEQDCAKAMAVSPFTSRAGQYSFHVQPAASREGAPVVVGVALRDATGPVLKTHFHGRRRALSDRALAAMLVRHPLMTLKVVAAIHFEAARLWFKGVPIVQRHKSPAFSVSVIAPVTGKAAHAE